MMMDCSYNSDGHSSCGENRVRNEETELKNCIKVMLGTYLFVGTFVEKRFVPNINEYRHIIKVNDAEVDFINHLKVSKRKMKQFYGENKWIGITDELSLGSPAGINIWTKLTEEKFGTYWFQIKTVKLHHNEVTLRVKVIRPYLRECNVDTSPKHSSQYVDYSFESLVATLSASFEYLFTDVLSVKNALHVIVFMILLLASVLTGSFRIIQYMLEFSLKLGRVLNESIVALTPTFIALINATLSVIFGLFKLIAHVFAPRNQNPAVVVISQDHMRYMISPHRQISNRPYVPSYYGNSFRRSHNGVQIREIE